MIIDEDLRSYSYRENNVMGVAQFVQAFYFLVYSFKVSLPFDKLVFNYSLWE